LSGRAKTLHFALGIAPSPATLRPPRESRGSFSGRPWHGQEIDGESGAIPERYRHCDPTPSNARGSQIASLKEIV
jgi:hypothetical protein